MRVLVIVCLVAAGCSDDSEPQPTELTLPASSSDAVASGAADAGTTSTTTTSTTTTTLRPPPPTDPPELDPTTIGDLEVPCGVGGATLPERTGVTDDAIVIGIGTDRGGIATVDSGLGAIGMVEGLVDYCNAEGGLFGRDLRLVEYDAAGVEGVARVEEACAEVSALVGTTFLEVGATNFAALSCGLPMYRAETDLVPVAPFSLHGHIAALFADPAEAGDVVLVGPATADGAADRALRRVALEAAVGLFNVRAEVAYPIDSPPNWSRLVGDARASGAGQVHLRGGCRQAVLPFLEIADNAGWNPVVVVGPEAYDAECFGVADPSRLIVEIPFLPFEDGSAAAATAAHAELLDRIGAPRTGTALMAAGSFWRWAVTAVRCLPDADVVCADQALALTDGWTAGGLHQAISADRRSEGCAVVLGIEAGAFVRILPEAAGTYDCEPDRSVDTTLETPDEPAADGSAVDS